MITKRRNNMQCPFYEKLKESNLLEITDESTVGDLTSTIESFFDLPEGSVALFNRDGTRARSNKFLVTVKKEWDY